MSTEPIITRSNFTPRRFPLELLFDIFTRLPGKSVLRFKCASKSIRSMLEEEPHFINRHLKHTLEAKRDRILLLKDRKEFYCVDLDSVHHSVREIIPPLLGPAVVDPYEFEIVGSCNGLFCLVSKPTSCSIYRNLKTAVVLWNVLTGEYKILPIDEARRPAIEEEETYCFGPVYGFGYDAISSDYKVVRISHFLCAGICTTEAKVCSAKENTWRNVQSECPYVLDWPLGHSVFVNGALHWVCYDQQPHNDFPHFLEPVEHYRHIMAFNLQTEEFGLVPCNMSHARNFYLGAIDGQLSISHSLRGIVEISVMNYYGVIESWCHLVSVDLTGRTLIGSGNSRVVRPLAYSKSRNEALVEEEFGRNHGRRSLTWCDLATQQTRDWEMPRFFNQVEVGVASLVSLGDSIGIGRN